MRLSIAKYKERLEKQFGFADPDMLQRYANARAEHKASLKDFNVYTSDPKCKTCKKRT